MDARDRRYRKEAEERARAYAAIKRGYRAPEEKKAFRIAEKLRRAEWMDSLAALDEGERRARLRAFRVFRTRVFFASLFGKGRGARPAADTPSAPEGGHIFTEK